MPEFPLLDRDCPGLLDVLIGLEDHGYLAFRLAGDPRLNLLAVTAAPAPLPGWLARGLRERLAELVARLRPIAPPGEGDVLAVLVATDE